jgi:hypothetical protein
MASVFKYTDIIATYFQSHLVFFGVIVLVLLFTVIVFASFSQVKAKMDVSQANDELPKRSLFFRCVARLLKFVTPLMQLYWIGIYLVLFKLGICNLTLTILLVIVDTRSWWCPEKVLKRLSGIRLKWLSLFLEVFITSTMVYALFSVQYFEENRSIKYLFLIRYAIAFFTSFSRINANDIYFESSENKEEAMSILMQRSSTPAAMLPLGLLLNVWIIDFFCLLSGITSFAKNPINFGYIDSRNRVNALSFNSDSVSQVVLMAVGTSILLVGSFDIRSLFIFVGVISIWPYLRKSPSKLSKYFTAVVGEEYIMRPTVYDNLLMRVLPDFKKDWLSSMYLKKSNYSYSIFFHNQRKLWDKKQGVLEVKDLVKSCNHLFVLFEASESRVNYVGEYDLTYALSRPDVIIDTWMCSLKVGTLFGDIKGDDKWMRLRLDIIRRISDEDYGAIEGDATRYKEGSYTRHVADSLLVRQNIVNSSSFESLRQNIQLFEHQYKEADHERVRQLTGKGIYELNTLFRQLHESPSIPSRFIDLLNVAECMIRYLVGFLHAERVDDGKVLHGNLPFDTKAIAFGSCTDFLARWKKLDGAGETILGARVSALLDVVYDDTENVEALVKYIRIMNPGVTAKYSQKPTLLELSWWMVTVRNKTRGHGTPSKVDYGFYVCLEKAVLFMLAECSKLELTPCYIAEVDGQKWTFHLSSGGYPEPVPVLDELQKGVHFNPLLEDEMIERLTANHRHIVAHIPAGDEALYLYVTEGEKTEWWRCHKHFQVRDAIVHLLNQRDDKKESWISFSTGRIMRPEISEL